MKQICLICGMEVNDNNKNINKNAFIYENSENGIKYCPFCGASEEYLIGIDITNENNKRNELSIETKRILDHAVKLELFNADFYKKASIQAESTEVKAKFLDLSAIERMHANIHFKLGKFDKMPILSNINYHRYKGDTILIEQAILREKHAVAYYNKYLPFVEEEFIREILIALRDIEQGHIELLA